MVERYYSPLLCTYKKIEYSKYKTHRWTSYGYFNTYQCIECKMLVRIFTTEDLNVNLRRFNFTLQSLVNEDVYRSNFGNVSCDEALIKDIIE
jgi:hypothetical protein